MAFLTGHEKATWVSHNQSANEKVDKDSFQYEFCKKLQSEIIKKIIIKGKKNENFPFLIIFKRYQHA